MLISVALSHDTKVLVSEKDSPHIIARMRIYARDAVIICILTFALLEGSLRLYHYISPLFIFPDNSDNRFRGKPFDSDYGFTLNSGGSMTQNFSQRKLLAPFA